jgi:serine/threonine protein kinase
VNIAEDLSGQLTAQLCDAMAVSHFFENDITRTNHFCSTFTFRGLLTVTSSLRYYPFSYRGCMLTPSKNILLTSDDPPFVKVADFGLAKCVNSKTMLKV